MLQSSCASFSCNSMPRNGCSALHGVNHNKKKDIVHFKVIFCEKWILIPQIFDLWDQEIDS